MSPGEPLGSWIVTVGDELLAGRRLDTNSAWIGRALGGLGIPVLGRTTVGDEDEAIRESTAAALAAARLVVVTGGLGPTEDDRTRAAVAALLGRRLSEDAQVLARLMERFRARGYDALPPANLSQALVPEGGRVLDNPAGTAPGLALDTEGGGLVILLPGPPREVQAVFTKVVGEIQGRFGADLRPVYTRMLHTTGISESVLGPRVGTALPPPRDVELSFLPHLVGVSVGLMVSDTHEPAEAAARLDRAQARLEAVLGRHVFEVDGEGDLAAVVQARLEERGATVATAESCTGGLLAMRLTERSGASRTFVGGVVAYADEVKREVLGVSGTTLQECGAVSEEVASELAAGVRRSTGADFGIGITGVAGPTGGSDEKPVGTVCYAISSSEGQVARTVALAGDRQAVRARAAQMALATLLGLLEEGA